MKCLEWMDGIIRQTELPALRSRNREKILVAACGCFDIFHVGHLAYLQGAKQCGALLFVGVNSDRSVYENKGRMPVFSAEQRMEVLAALRCVDYVFCFEEPTFENCLCLLKPDVFARGADAHQKCFPEKNCVEEHHITVKIIEDCKLASSRKLRKYFE